VSQLSQTRNLALGGPPVSKSTGTLASSTVPLFTIAGGLVVVTSIVGVVTTAITVANSYKLQSNPTTGTTVDICAATDLGTNDTAVGDTLSPAGGGGIVRGLGVAGSSDGLVLPIGQIEHVSTGTDGAITWYVTWYAYQDGATLVAA
jgi:hypothetical protein